MAGGQEQVTIIKHTFVQNSFLKWQIYTKSWHRSASAVAFMCLQRCYVYNAAQRCHKYMYTAIPTVCLMLGAEVGLSRLALMQNCVYTEFRAIEVYRCLKTMG